MIGHSATNPYNIPSTPVILGLAPDTSLSASALALDFGLHENGQKALIDENKRRFHLTMCASIQAYASLGGIGNGSLQLSKTVSHIQII